MIERVVGGTGNSQTVQFMNWKGGSSGRTGTWKTPEGETGSFQLQFKSADKPPTRIKKSGSEFKMVSYHDYPDGPRPRHEE